MANTKPEAHPKLNEREYAVAAITGLGLLLTILAGMFDAFGTQETLLGLEFTTLFWGGVLLMFVGLLLWWTLKPWENFDDLKTPYFTGHDHHDEAHHDEAAPDNDVAHEPSAH